MIRWEGDLAKDFFEEAKECFGLRSGHHDWFIERYQDPFDFEDRCCIREALIAEVWGLTDFAYCETIPRGLFIAFEKYDPGNQWWPILKGRGISSNRLWFDDMFERDEAPKDDDDRKCVREQLYAEVLGLTEPV